MKQFRDLTNVKLTGIKCTEANVAYADPTGATWSNPTGPDESNGDTKRRSGCG